jgi:hypothetical protein
MPDNNQCEGSQTLSGQFEEKNIKHNRLKMEKTILISKCMLPKWKWNPNFLVILQVNMLFQNNHT